jgi:DNA-binding NarL/FixJ family response regulator
VAVAESDPLRVVGFRTLLDGEPSFELIFVSPAEIEGRPEVQLVLLGECPGQGLQEVMSRLRARRGDLRIIVIGSGMDPEAIFGAIAAGAKGYVDQAASPQEFAQAIRTVSQGSMWAPRPVLSMFIDRSTALSRPVFPGSRAAFTAREKQVLEMLVAGRSNKEIGVPLGIEERTVKAHIAKMMRKVGVQNRIALSVHAITHALVAAQ